MGWDDEPDVGKVLPSVYIPQLRPIRVAFRDQKELLMSLSQKLDDLQAAFATEASELKSAFADLRAKVEAGQTAQAELDAAETRVDNVITSFGSFAEEASADPNVPGAETPPVETPPAETPPAEPPIV